MTIALDDWDQSVIIVPDDMQIVNAVPYNDSAMAIANCTSVRLLSAATCFSRSATSRKRTKVSP